ncbi:hypothetical protein [Nitrobacter sp. TKz-YC02]|uniref:hypothetical protein n=1 Tax=Nitrobacter sp. TKz-YC02 TaxID=3398704 RepID=UPI003CED1BE3
MRRKSAYKGRAIRMDKLDSPVTEQLVERLLQAERLAVILSSLKARRTAKAASENKRIMAL